MYFPFTSGRIAAVKSAVTPVDAADVTAVAMEVALSVEYCARVPG
jgi:hypothetical protein